jgi:hypothetical protein
VRGTSYIEHRLRVFECGVLRETLSGAKREEVTCDCRKLHNEELNDLYYSPDIIKSRTMSWAGNVARNGGKGKAYRILAKKNKL